MASLGVISGVDSCPWGTLLGRGLMKQAPVGTAEIGSCSPDGGWRQASRGGRAQGRALLDHHNRHHGNNHHNGNSPSSPAGLGDPGTRSEWHIGVGPHGNQLREGQWRFCTHAASSSHSLD